MSQQQNIKSNQQAKRTTVKKQDSSFHALLYELTLEGMTQPYCEFSQLKCSHQGNSLTHVTSY
ncbi:hypothetical protein I79_001930 [Cricetulus griseus]|uniref:Uncharacterized protein n=1 Tax=Cricetulus griseus TaxID=10029 RepID=G3GW19_CRIGR|nr:hypothetical protein I79_001930 [Cricetulus griseus]